MKQLQINTIEDAANIQVRMMSALVKNNGVSGFWSTSRKAHLYCLTLVIEDSNNNLNGYICLDTYTKVSNNEYISMYKPLYKWQAGKNGESPDRLFLISSILRGKDSIRNPAQIFRSIGRNSKYMAITNKIKSTIPSTVSFPDIVNISLKMIDIVKEHIVSVAKIPVATTAVCYNKDFGELSREGCELTYKSTKNVDFEYELTISKERHKNNEDKVTLPLNNLFTNTANIFAM